MTDANLQSTVRIAAEASLFVVDGDVLRPYVIHKLPEEYIAGIGPVRIGSQCCGRAVQSKKKHFARLIAITMKGLEPYTFEKWVFA